MQLSPDTTRVSLHVFAAIILVYLSLLSFVILPDPIGLVLLVVALIYVSRIEKLLEKRSQKISEPLSSSDSISLTSSFQAEKKVA